MDKQRVRDYADSNPFFLLLLFVSAAKLQSEEQVTPVHARILNMQLTLLYPVTQVRSSNQVRMA